MPLAIGAERRRSRRQALSLGAFNVALRRLVARDLCSVAHDLHARPVFELARVCFHNPSAASAVPLEMASIDIIRSTVRARVHGTVDGALLFETPRGPSDSQRRPQRYLRRRGALDRRGVPRTASMAGVIVDLVSPTRPYMMALGIVPRVSMRRAIGPRARITILVRLRLFADGVSLWRVKLPPVRQSVPDVAVPQAQCP